MICYREFDLIFAGVFPLREALVPPVYILDGYHGIGDLHTLPHDDGVGCRS